MNILVTIMSILTFIAVIIMIYKILIEYKQNLEREFEKLQQENKQLKEEIEEQKKYNTELMLCNSGFNAILTELEEWLKEETKLCDDYLIGECHTDYTDVLDKIQELKEKYK